jgi:acyl-CoA synthetase (AMP-forming)/AMP-acid ligase II
MKELSPSMDAVMDSLIKNLTAKGSMFETENRNLDGIDYPFFKNLLPNLNSLYQMGGQFSDKKFLVHHDKSLTFKGTLERVEKLAKILVAEYGLKKNDRVGIAMRNSPEWCIAFMAITAAGGVAVAMNSWWKKDELIYAIKDTNPRVMFVDDKRCSYIEPFIEEYGFNVVIDKLSDNFSYTHSHRSITCFDELMNKKLEDSILLPEVNQNDNAVIFYTSGSTGFPKGALSTHRMLLNTIFTWALTATAFGLLNQKKDKPTEHQLSALLCLPLFHVTACYSAFLLSLVIGRKIVFIDKWDVEIAMQKIEEEKVTHFIGVPTMSYELLHCTKREEYDLSSLAEIGGGGSARPSSQVKEIQEAFQIPLTTGYGMTETNGVGCINGGDNYLDKPDSVGKATAPTTLIKIVDDNGVEVCTGQRGEILIKSASNIKCYWNDEKATDELFVDGWVKTGDIGFLDEQEYLFIVDRKKDIVIRGGENISTQEVESSIAAHPSVKEVCVFGIPDERLGEVPIAIAALHDKAELSKESLIHFLNNNIAHFKVPVDIQIMCGALPRGATGKMDKLNIRKEYLNSLLK